jgi:hypothetical protein
MHAGTPDKPEKEKQMKNAFAAITFAALFAPPLLAQEIEASRRAPPGAPDSALEIGIGAGYSQGFGNIGPDSPTLTDLTHGGGEVTLSVGYRINPNFLVGIYGSGGMFTTGNLTSGADSIWSATGGVQANYHFLPTAQWDPWVGLGAGWRGHWISKPGGTHSRHGLDLARLQVGLDYRVSPEFAISPYVGAALTSFLTQELAAQQVFTNVRDPNVNVFVVGGVMGRFDLFGGSRTYVASN